MKIIKLHFSSPLHLGYKEGIQESTIDTISSDLLFSVFCQSYRKLYGLKELEELLERFLDKPLFRLTSALPFIRDEYYFPRPIGLNLVKYGFLPKSAKKVKYFNQDIFFKAVSGTLTVGDFKDYEESSWQGLLVKKGQDKEPVFIERELPRVSLDRLTSASSIFYFTELSFASGCGLYFGVDGIDEGFWSKFTAAWYLASDEGIGGDRSVGKGQFRIELVENIDMPKIEKPQSFVLLSRFYPSSSEFSSLDGDFMLQKRAGYMYSLNETARRKKSLQMFVEGSLFYQSTPMRGQMVDITPEGFSQHRVYANGYALAMPSLIVKEEVQNG